MCPGEFEDFLEGVVDGERDRSMVLASIGALVSTIGGARTTPQGFLGEPVTTEEPTTDEMRRASLQRQFELRIRKAQGWLPDGINLDEE